MKNGLHIDEDGTKEWYLYGKLHRTDGPAVEWANGHKEWWLNGAIHRTDGPAAEWADGTKYWYVDGQHLGYGDQGFWKLWELLSDGQRNNVNLLMHLPKI